MTRMTRLFTALFITGAVIVLDRITKIWALCHLHEPVTVNKFLSFELVLNRGISGGFLHFESTLGFVIVSTLITTILMTIAIWTWRMYKRQENITGQCLILAGGFSNILDRIIYGGVVDFISISFNGWHWALFNIADIAINIGVVILIIQNLLEHNDT